MAAKCTAICCVLLGSIPLRGWSDLCTFSEQSPYYRPTKPSIDIYIGRTTLGLFQNLEWIKFVRVCVSFGFIIRLLIQEMLLEKLLILEL